VKAQRLKPPRRRYSVRSIGRKSGNVYPCLDSRFKAAYSKPQVFWIATVTKDRGHLGEDARLLAICSWALAEVHHTMDRCGVLFTPEEAAHFHQVGAFYLKAYHALASRAYDAGQCNFKLLPKHHVLQHIFETALTGRENPRFLHCFADEDLMGRMARIAGRCHRSTVIRRTFQRYWLSLQQKWRRAVRRNCRRAASEGRGEGLSASAQLLARWTLESHGAISRARAACPKRSRVQAISGVAQQASPDASGCLQMPRHASPPGGSLSLPRKGRGLGILGSIPEARNPHLWSL